jgi:hypothetical protein
MERYMRDADIQYRHEYGEPEFLQAEQRVRASPPLSRVDVEEIPGDYKDPGSLTWVGHVSTGLRFSKSLKSPLTASPSHPMNL